MLVKVINTVTKKCEDIETIKSDVVQHEDLSMLKIVTDEAHYDISKLSTSINWDSKNKGLLIKSNEYVFYFWFEDINDAEFYYNKFKYLLKHNKFNEKRFKQYVSKTDILTSLAQFVGCGGILFLTLYVSFILDGDDNIKLFMAILCSTILFLISSFGMLRVVLKKSTTFCNTLISVIFLIIAISFIPNIMCDFNINKNLFKHLSHKEVVQKQSAIIINDYDYDASMAFNKIKIEMDNDYFYALIMDPNAYADLLPGSTIEVSYDRYSLLWLSYIDNIKAEDIIKKKTLNDLEGRIVLGSEIKMIKLAVRGYDMINIKVINSENEEVEISPLSKYELHVDNYNLTFKEIK